MFLAITSAISTSDVLGGFSPYRDLAFVSPEPIPLVVSRAESAIADQTGGQDGSGLERGEVGWIAGKILHLESVKSGQEGRVAPGEGEAEMVMADVDGPCVPGRISR